MVLLFSYPEAGVTGPADLSTASREIETTRPESLH